MNVILTTLRVQSSEAESGGSLDDISLILLITFI